MIPRSPAKVSRPRGIPGGRLTFQSGTPVLTVDSLNGTSTFYTPYNHDLIPIFDGAGWAEYQFAELENITTDSAVGNAGPAAVVANSNYDLFVWRDSAGVLFLTRGPVWTNTTTRSAGTALVRVEGTLMNAVTITNGPAAQRGTYVGTISSDPTSTLDWKHGGKASGGSSGYFNVWNMYNRKLVQAHSFESDVSWTYAGGILLWRAFNQSLNNRVSYVVGLAEDPVFATIHCNVASTGLAGVPYVGVGLDSVLVRSGTSTFNALSSFGEIWGRTDVNVLGFHFLQAIEFNNAPAPNTALFYGDIGIPLIAQSGFFFWGWF